MANGFFSKTIGRVGTGLRLDLTNVIITVVLTLVLFQAFGLVFGESIGIDIKLGPIFILLPLGFAAVLGVAIVKKMIMNQPVTRADMFAIIVTLLVALLVMFFLRDFVPEIFSDDMIALQSLIGFD